MSKLSEKEIATLSIDQIQLVGTIPSSCAGSHVPTADLSIDQIQLVGNDMRRSALMYEHLLELAAEGLITDKEAKSWLVQYECDTGDESLRDIYRYRADPHETCVVRAGTMRGDR